MEESIESGTSVIDWTSCTVWARIAGSSASGMPALTSSIWAPASTWAIASATTVSKLPDAISAASALRPVGLIRSPITTNGRSKPITTSLVADDSTVSVTRSLSVRAHEPFEQVVRVRGLEPFDLLRDLGFEVVPATSAAHGATPRGMPQYPDDQVAEQYLKKGSKVYVEGQLQTRKWQDQSGQDKYTTEVVIQRFRGDLTLLDSRGGGDAQVSDRGRRLRPVHADGARRRWRVGWPRRQRPVLRRGTRRRDPVLGGALLTPFP